MFTNTHLKVLEQIQGRVLFLESMPSNFIIGGAELALQLAERGNDVFFCYVSDRISWKDLKGPKIKRLIGYNLERHIPALISYLAQTSVTLVRPPTLGENILQECRKFSMQLPSSLAELKQLRYKEVPLGLGVVSTLINRTGDSRFSVKRYKNDVAESLMCSAIVYERATSLILAIDPDYVVLCNGRHSLSFPIEQASSQRRKRTIWHEKSPSGRLITVFEEKLHNCDSIATNIERVTQSVGQASLDKNAQEYFSEGLQLKENSEFLSSVVDGKLPKLNESLKTVVFFHSSEDEFSSVDIRPFGLFKDQFAAVEYLDTHFYNQPKKVNFVVRIHPHLEKKAKSEKKFWNALNLRYGTLIPSNSPIDSHALLLQADCAITFGSSLTCNANYLRIPVILLNQISPFVLLKMAAVPQTKEQLNTYLNNFSEVPVLSGEPSKKWAFFRIVSDHLGVPFNHFKYNKRDNCYLSPEGRVLSTVPKGYTIARRFLKKSKVF